MLQLSQEAATQLEQVRQQQGLPDTAGIRLSGVPMDDGNVGIHVAFAEAPAEGDQVAEQEGTKVFVAPELADPLADAELHVENSNEGMQLTLRKQEDDTPDA